MVKAPEHFELNVMPPEIMDTLINYCVYVCARVCVCVNCVCLWHTGTNSVTQGFCSIIPCNDTQSHFVQGDTSIFWIYCGEHSLSWWASVENSVRSVCVFVLSIYLCVCVLSSGKEGNGIKCSDHWSWKLPIHWFDKQQERPLWYTARRGVHICLCVSVCACLHIVVCVCVCQEWNRKRKWEFCCGGVCACVSCAEVQNQNEIVCILGIHASLRLFTHMYVRRKPFVNTLHSAVIPLFCSTSAHFLHLLLLLDMMHFHFCSFKRKTTQKRKDEIIDQRQTKWKCSQAARSNGILLYDVEEIWTDIMQNDCGY